MNDRQLNDIEQRALDTLLEGDGPVFHVLRAQARGAVVSKRTLTGVGFYVDFEPMLDQEPGPDMVVEGAYATAPGATSPDVGFLLFVKGGQLSVLEGYTTCDEWPSVGLDWTFSRIEVN